MDTLLLTAEDVARRLRIKKYTVYELIKRGELPSTRVGKRVRVSQEDIDRYLRAGKTGPFQDADDYPGAWHGSAGEGGADGINEEPDAAKQARRVIISGQDRCLELLITKAGNETGDQVFRSYTGCYSSLVALYLGKITMAASHLWDAETDTYNYPFIRRLLPGLPVGVLRLAGRMQGFYVKKGNPLGIRDWGDLARTDLVMINRERGCGTRILLDQKLRLSGIKAGNIRGYSHEYASHIACASAVARGGADLGCGCENAASGMAGVDFIPLQLEWYDFVFRLEDRHIPAVKAVLAYVDSGEFRKDLEMTGAYDLSRTGYYEEF
ncbi:MAG: helix-turn-helix transcriptional regulator [Treponema sp.]|jgi:putative molybdopterin biosynthesis protein|nr:helix-turn-helix transcriptional regulator [Treponema sp.]